MSTYETRRIDGRLERRCTDCGIWFEPDATPEYPHGTWRVCGTCRSTRGKAIRREGGANVLAAVGDRNAARP